MTQHGGWTGFVSPRALVVLADYNSPMVLSYSLNLVYEATIRTSMLNGVRVMLVLTGCLNFRLGQVLLW